MTVCSHVVSVVFCLHRAMATGGEPENVTAAVHRLLILDDDVDDDGDRKPQVQERGRGRSRAQTRGASLNRLR